MGEKILQLLKERNMTQKEFAQKVGISEVSMSRYITNQRTPKGTTVLNMARVLGVTPEELLGYEANFDAEYATIERLIARNAKKMSGSQKARLVNYLLAFEEIDG